MQFSNIILLQKPTHTTVGIIWTKPMIMVLESPRLKLGPKTRITWSWGPICFLTDIDFSCALHTDIFLQCKTLHYKTKRATINMLEAIPRHNFIDHYATLRKYR